MATRLDEGSTRGAVQNRPHRDPIYLVTLDGYSSTWVCCPVCGSVADGWWGNGKPRYSGGGFDVLLPSELSSHQVECVAACRCEAGQLNHHRPIGPMAFFDQLGPDALFVNPLPLILFVRGIDRGAPPEIEAPGQEMGEFIRKANRLLAAQKSGRLSPEDARRGIDDLAARELPPPYGLPTVSGLLTDRELRERYCSHFPDWRGSPASGVGGR